MTVCYDEFGSGGGCRLGLWLCFVLCRNLCYDVFWEWEGGRKLAKILNLCFVVTFCYNEFKSGGGRKLA